MRSEENCVLLGYYAPSSGNSLGNFRDNRSVPYSRVNNPKHAENRSMRFCKGENVGRGNKVSS